jgi:SAM-dependent methyltransferase
MEKSYYVYSTNKTIKINAIAGDIYTPPVGKPIFKGIILSEVLEHLEDPVEALKSIYPLLCNDGKLIVSVPYKEKIKYQLCIHCNKRTPSHAHLHSFDKSKMEKLMATAGFSIEKTSKNLNKVAQRLYFYIIIRRFPFPVWKFFDMFFNIIIAKPTSFIFVAKKRSDWSENNNK